MKFKLIIVLLIILFMIIPLYKWLDTNNYFKKIESLDGVEKISIYMMGAEIVGSKKYKEYDDIKVGDIISIFYIETDEFLAEGIYRGYLDGYYGLSSKSNHLVDITKRDKTYLFKFDADLYKVEIRK